MANLFSPLPVNFETEVVESLMRAGNCRIERIVSFGHSTPPGECYCQSEHEWVILLSGSAELSFEGGDRLSMQPGDYVNIPAFVRHRVEATSAEEPSVWLAVFYT